MKYLIVLLLISTQAQAEERRAENGTGARELTYSSNPGYADRNEEFVYKAIRAQAAKHASNMGVLAIDGSAPAIQVTSNDEYSALVHQIIAEAK